MSELKKGFKKEMYKNDSMLNSIHSDLNKKYHRPRKFLITLSAFAVALFMFIGTNNISNTHTTSVFARVSVDINPSLELVIDENRMVTDVIYYNEDAENMDIDFVVGLKVNEAIKEIADIAKAQGYIRTDDPQADYIVVATNIVDEDNDLSDEEEDEAGLVLSEEMAAQLNSLQALSVVYLVASDEEADEADEKGESLGIHLINGLVETNDGTTLTVKEFVLSTANLESLSESAVSFSNQDIHMANLITKFVYDMAEYGLNLDLYDEELNSVEDLVKLKTVMAKIRNELRVETLKEEKAIATEERDAAKLAAEEERAAEAALREAERAAAEAEREAAKAEAAAAREAEKTEDQ